MNLIIILTIEINNNNNKNDIVWLILSLPKPNIYNSFYLVLFRNILISYRAEYLKSFLSSFYK